jgi:hypothetical protein
MSLGDEIEPSLQFPNSFVFFVASCSENRSKRLRKGKERIAISESKLSPHFLFVSPEFPNPAVRQTPDEVEA